MRSATNFYHSPASTDLQVSERLLMSSADYPVCKASYGHTYGTDVRNAETKSIDDAFAARHRQRQ